MIAQRSTRAIAVVLVFAPVFALAAGASAQTPSAAPSSSSSAPPPAPSVPPPAASSADAAREKALGVAKEEFRQGNALYEAGQYEAALERFLQSRAAFPSRQNTVNAALCLEKLGRDDEAVAMYETALAEFATSMDDEQRAGIVSALDRLKGRVGTLQVAANVDGATVLVDGRARGKVPLSRPLRVLPGSHRVRVVKDGYATFEAPITVAAGASASIDAKLEPLAASGILRVEDPTLAGAAIEVDGVPVGNAPWEGLVATGSHVVASRLGHRGSPLTPVTVLRGQAALVRLQSGPLGPRTRIAVSPRTADLQIDGIALGKGQWEGELPTGHHRVDAFEEGYFPGTASLDVTATEAPPIELALRVDPSHPRWPKPERGHFWAEALVGYGIGPSLGSDAENDCAVACSRKSPAHGPLGGVRAGYELPFGVSGEISAGYLSFAATSARRHATSYTSLGLPATADYDVDDVVRFKAFWVTIGGSYRYPLSSMWALRGRLGAGVAFVRSYDPISGVARDDEGDSVVFGVSGAGAGVTSTPLVVVPEIGAEASWHEWRFGAMLGAIFVPSGGPSFSRGPLTVPPSCTAADPTAIGCAPTSNALANERAYGPFLLVVPRIGVARVL